MKYDTITLLAYWASAIINGDWSGMEDEAEKERCSKAIGELAAEGWSIVDIAHGESDEKQEARFTWSYRLYDPGADCAGGDVLDYVILRSRKRE